MEKKEVLCNMCGLSCWLEGPCGRNAGLIDTKILGGYHSTPGNGEGALDDMTEYNFSLCEFCLDYIFSQFKIPVSVKEYGSDRYEKFKPAMVRVIEDSWRNFKDEFFLEYNRRFQARNQTSKN